MGNYLVNAYERQLKGAIDEWGRQVVIQYQSTANCSSCSYNPITMEATNSDCDTCNGTFFYNTTTSKGIVAIVRTFLGDKGFLDWGQNKINFYPEADARLTCWLGDVLEDADSATGKTYFDRTDQVTVDGKEYAPHHIFKTGLKDLKICIVNLKEIKI